MAAGSRAAEGSSREIDVRTGCSADEVAAPVAGGQDSGGVGMAGVRKRRKAWPEEAFHRTSGAEEHTGTDSCSGHRRARQDKVRRDQGGPRNQEVHRRKGRAGRRPAPRRRLCHLGHRLPQQRPSMASGTALSGTGFLLRYLFHVVGS